VVVVRKDVAEKKADLVTRVVAVFAKVSDRTVKDTAAVARAIQQKFYEKVPEPVIAEAVESLKDGVDRQGRMSVASIDYLLKFSAATGAALEKRLDAARGENDFWTNRFIEQAVGK